MNRDPVALLLYEAKRRPHIQALVDRASSLSDEEIETVEVPLKWYRQALRDLRTRKAFAEDDVVLESKYETSVNFQQGEIRRYTGPTAFVVFESSGSDPVELEHGTLLWVEKKGMWFDHLFTFKTLESVFVATGDKRDYRDHREQQLADKYGLDYITDDDKEAERVYTDSNGTQVRQRSIRAADFRGSTVPVLRIG